MDSTMQNGTHSPPFKNYVTDRFFYLLASLLLLVALSPLTGSPDQPKILSEILFTAILLSGIWSVSRKSRDTIVALILAVPMLTTLWLNLWFDNKSLSLASDIASAIFLIYTMAIILGFIFKQQLVTKDVIFASVVVYLVIGVLWSLFYSMFEILAPGSFAFANAEPGTSPLQFSYFSFVTLTTLGYGDIAPLSPPAKSFAILEAIIGQMYIAVLIARLVGMYAANLTRKRD
jgi:Ion channel